MKTKRYPIKAVELTQQKPIKQREGYLELTGTYLKWVLSFRAEEPMIWDDEKSGKTERDNYYEEIALKHCISGLQKHLLSDTDKWKVVVQVMGFSTDINLYFDERKQADEMFKIISDWLFAPNLNGIHHS